MNSQNKRIAKNTLMLYIRMMLIMLVTLYTSRIILRVLGVEDFGIYNIVGGVVVMFGFLNTAMSTATQRFLSFELGCKNQKQLEKVFSSALLIHIIIALFVFVIAETVGLWFLNTQLTISADRMNAANWVYQFSVFAFMINIMSVPYNAVIVSHEQMNIYAYVSIVEVLLKLAIVYLLEVFGFDKLKMYAFLIFAISLLIRVVYQVYCRQKFVECKFNFVWDRNLLKKLMSFSGWSMFGGIAYIAKSQGVNVVINIFYGTIVNAAWGISQQVNTAILSFVQNFTTALNPPLVKAYANKDLVNLYSLLFEGMKYTFFLSYCVVIPLFFETDYILSLWLVDVPEYSVAFVKLLLISVLIETLASVVGSTVQAIGRVKWYQIIIGGVLFFNLPLSYIAVRITHTPISTMYVAVALSVLSMILRFWILYRLIPYPIERLMKLFRLILLLCLCTLPIIVFTQCLLPGIVRFGLILFLNIIVASLILIFGGMSKMQRFALWQQISIYINRLITKSKTIC